MTNSLTLEAIESPSFLSLEHVVQFILQCGEASAWTHGKTTLVLTMH
jgi:hypothetical protein